ncbi:MAG: hypothetical protein KBT13_01475 [Bacteroidales bacterium]|uniref:hypothetical protein n=1 Tax=Sodaliphilus sp. TaxID=2815818 RepID=UPI001B51AA53|nr:hypothetical protein [Candidatus Sodaliphilus limicaballi]
MILQYTLLVAGIACLVAALVLVLRPRFVAAIPAFAGLWMTHASYFIKVSDTYLIFWGIAAMLVAGISYLSPKGEPDGRKSSNIYLGLGAVMGALLGMATDPRFMVLGVILGAMSGQYIYSRTPHGQWLKPATRDFWKYFAAKGLSVVVAISIIAVAAEGFIKGYN